MLHCMSDPVIDALNSGTEAEFVARLGAVYEHSPWIAEAAWAKRPFRDRDDLARRMQDVLMQAPRAQQDQVIRAHPDLGGRLARAGVLTPHSRDEQASLGLDHLASEDYDRLDQFNRDYAQKFGFPFIAALRDHSLGSLIDSMSRRVSNTPDEEHAAALFQIGRIAWYRINDLR
jgi:2-oxo-4-hydroxy-4-carboxy-5-ureidoimidazoline decarboxylase